LQAEADNEEQLQSALEAARASMRFGDLFGAVAALESVIELCSFKGPLGGRVSACTDTTVTAVSCNGYACVSSSGC
jgi:hypothetical protein